MENTRNKTKLEIDAVKERVKLVNFNNIWNGKVIGLYPITAIKSKSCEVWKSYGIYTLFLHFFN